MMDRPDSEIPLLSAARNVIRRTIKIIEVVYVEFPNNFARNQLMKQAVCYVAVKVAVEMKEFRPRPSKSNL